MSDGRADNNLVTPLRTQEISSLWLLQSFLFSQYSYSTLCARAHSGRCFSCFFGFSFLFKWHNFHNALSGITADRCAIIGHYHKQFRAVCTWLNWNYQGRNACRAKWRALKKTHKRTHIPADFDISKYLIIFGNIFLPRQAVEEILFFRDW